MRILNQANLFKILFVFLLLIAELKFFYEQQTPYRVAAYVLMYLYFSYWYYSETKKQFKLADKLILISFISVVFSAFPQVLYGKKWGIILEIIIFAIGHLLIIVAYHTEQSFFKFKKIIRTNITISLPFIIFPIVFLCYVLLPMSAMKYWFMLISFLVQIIYLSMLSFSLPYSPENKLYISLSSFFLFLTTGIYAYNVFLSSSFAAHAMVRATSTLFRVFLIVGMSNRFIRH